ncbi:MAG: LptA/OstA family protein, partial [Rhodospirillales bacterium]
MALSWFSSAASKSLEDGQAIIEADTIEYNQSNESVSASGGVTITKGARVLRADHVEFIQSEGRIEAFGNVLLVEPSGELIKADSVELAN